MQSSNSEFRDEDRVDLAAHRLAVFFTDEAELPVRYRRLSDKHRKIRKIKTDSDIEKRFNANVESWRLLIETMLSRIDENQAWRFLNLAPKSDNSEIRISKNRDFCDFMDYMILRRDRDACDSNELGGLALLSVAIQRELEKPP